MDHNRIAVKLARHCVIAAFLLGLVISTVQIIRDFVNEGAALGQIVERVLNIAKPPAIAAARFLDEVQAAQIVNGLVTYDFVVEARIVSDLGVVLAARSKTKGDTSTLSITRYISGDEIRHVVSLKDATEGGALYGEMIVVIDPRQAFTGFFERSGLIVISGILRNLLLTLVLFGIFYFVLTKPLICLVDSLRAADSSNPQGMRLTAGPDHLADELGDLANGINRYVETSENHLKLRERTEQSLRESQTALRARERHIQGVLDNIADAVITIDEQGTIETFNSAAENIFGFSAQEAIGRKVSILMPEPDHGRHGSYLDAYRKTGKGKILGVGPREVTALHKNGHTFPVDLSVGEVMLGDRRVFIGAMRDITGRTQAEKALRESEEQLRAITDHSPSIIYLRDKDSNLLKINKTYEQFYGITQEEAVGRQGHEWLGEELAHRLINGDREVLSTGIPTKIEFEAVDSAGNARYMQSIKFPVLDDQGNAVAVGGTTTDITEHKKAERALSESEARYRDLIEGSELGIQIGSRDKGRIFANQACAELFGYDSTDELRAVPRQGLVADYDRERITKYRETLFAGEPVATTCEMDGVRKDGSIVPVQVFMRRILWEGEDAIQRTFIDLTDRKLAENALRASEAQLRLVTDNIPVQVAYVDRDHRIRFANQAYTEWYGISQDDIIGMHVRDVRGNEAFEESLPYSTRTLAGEVASNEGVRQFADGSQKYFRTTRVPHFGDDGEIQGYFVIFVDLTEHHEREAQLRQAQKMEAVGQLTGGVAHDFNNLLMAITGNLELLAERLQDDELNELALNSINSAFRGAELTQQLLSFSRKQTLAPKVIDLNDHVSRMTTMLRRTLGEAIEIDISTGDDLWTCEVDPGQLENAILNLAINARDAMPKGGTLAIETKNIHLDDDHVAKRDKVLSGDYVLVAVSDNGTGMSPAMTDRVFEPFFTTKDVGEGSGLGLSMVYGFIRQSGGDVAIESEVGVGTTVNLYLPRSAKIKAPEQQHRIEEEPGSHGERILVVEDDANVRTLFIDMLSGLGYDIVEAADGREAIEAMQRTPAFDLLFTDVILPGGMSGTDVAEEAIRRIPGIKVLYASGYADNVLFQDGRLDAGVQFINKPFRKAELARKVRDVLDEAAA